MDIKQIEKQKKEPHQVLKRIKYRRGLDGQRYIDPDPNTDWAKENITFEHLDNPGYLTLVKSRRIAPVKAGK